MYLTQCNLVADGTSRNLLASFGGGVGLVDNH